MKWFYMDDLKAYYFYRTLKNKTNTEQKASLISYILHSDKIDSVLKKLRNYTSLDVGRALQNCSKQSKKVHNKYKNKTIKEIKKDIKEKEKTDLCQSNFFKKLDINNRS